MVGGQVRPARKPPGADELLRDGLPPAVDRMGTATDRDAKRPQGRCPCTPRVVAWVLVQVARQERPRAF